MANYEFVAEALRTFNDEFKVKLWNKFCNSKRTLSSNIDYAKIERNDAKYFSRFLGAEDDSMWFVKALTNSEDYTYKETWVNMDRNYYNEPTFHSSDDPTVLMGIETNDSLYNEFLGYVADELFD